SLFFLDGLDLGARRPWCAGEDPSSEIFNLAVAQFAGGWHLELLVPVGNRFDQKTLFRLGRNEGGPSRTALQQRLTRVDTQTARRGCGMTCVAALDEDRA